MTDLPAEAVTDTLGYWLGIAMIVLWIAWEVLCDWIVRTRRTP